LEDRRLLAVIPVTTDQDIVDLNDGVTSLREAIFAANIVPGADEIVFDFGHDGPATILLTQGELQIADALTITGPGAGLLTIDAQQQSRIFNITATTGDFVFSGMMLTKGSTSTAGSAFGGGAMRSVTTGLVVVDDMQFIGNQTVGDLASGGAVYASRTLRISNSSFFDNSTNGISAGGGAVYAGSTLDIERSIFSSNWTGGSTSPGGAIQTPALNLNNSTVTDNETLGVNSPGGGIEIAANRSLIPSLLSDCIISENRTRGNFSTGGGINAAGKLTVQQSAIADNYTFGSNSQGGGLSAFVAVLTGSVVENNRTYGLNSGGGGVYGNTFREGWQITETSFSKNKTYGQGANGGALLCLGDISVTNSSFQHNETHGSGSNGGAIVVLNGGRLEITTTDFLRNAAHDGSGGAVAVQGGATIADSTFNGNRSKLGGGAIVQTSSTLGLTILRSRITGNEVIGPNAAGGGIRAESQMTITNSEISGNRVIGPNGRGGGLFVMRSATIVDSTISGNQITGEQAKGGGLYAARAVSMQYSTVTNNRIASSTGEAGGMWVPGNTSPTPNAVVISHSLIASNLVGTASSDLRSQPLLSYSLVGTNVGTQFVEAPVGVPDANGNLIGGPIHGVIDPLLGPLADNGGPTKTHALLPGSPAIDAGDPTLVVGANGVPLFDQRGAPFARIAGGRIDIGAFESQPATGLFNADFDGDGDINGRDFLLWQRGYGRTSGATLSDGDATVDGRVDGLDLVVWRETYGAAIAELELQNAESVETAPVQVVSGVLAVSHERDRVLTNDVPLTEHSEIRNVESDFVVDRAFDHWLPPRRISMDFGDIVVRREVKRQVVG
jgi:hypothetical protein